MKDRQEQDNVIIEYLPLIKSIAKSIYRKIPHIDFDYDDLVQIGVIGAIQAYHRLDHSLGCLRVYMSARIRGEIMDAIRYSDPLTRSQRVEARENGITGSFTESLNVLIDEYNLDWETDDPDIADVISDKQILELIFNKIAEFSPREIAIMKMIYIHGCDNTEVAKSLGLSLGRISQLRTRVLDRLRKHFEEDNACII